MQADRQTRRLLWLLSLASSLLMSLPWLVPHLGFVAMFGFVPLLCAERIATLSGVRRFWRWHYASFVLWNACTTFWVCNATVGGGIFAVLANALQMSLVFGLFRLSRKRFGGVLPYVLLATVWIAWEHLYFDAQISWPWLVLGGAFARSTRAVQWYCVTGTLGGSLWIWACNLALFGLMVALSDGRLFRWNAKARWAALLGSVIIVVAPFLVSERLYRSFDPAEGTPLEVVVAQPDFDPYEKFESLPQKEQNRILLDLLSEALGPDSTQRCLLLAPETFTGDVWLQDGEVVSSPTLAEFRQFMERYPGCDLLFGASAHTMHASGPAPSLLARRYGKGWVTSHNSALMTGADRLTEVFHKSKLVVGVEMTPWPRLFVPIDNKLGGVMGRNEGQREVSCLHLEKAAEQVPLGCAVCYESVYGAYCTEYVRHGAKLLTVITNDAWWGDTPGYRQHLSYARLRAIELRRDVARCANTGISAFIDARGDVLSQTPWWTRTTLRGTVRLRDGQTLFVRYGDVTGRICTLLAALLLAALLVRFLVRRP